jgi:hypothetical protein
MMLRREQLARLNRNLLKKGELEMTYLGLTLDQWKELGIAVLIVLGTAIIGRWFVHLLLRRVLKRSEAADDTTLNQVLFTVLWP